MLKGILKVFSLTMSLIMARTDKLYVPNFKLLNVMVASSVQADQL